MIIVGGEVERWGGGGGISTPGWGFESLQIT